MHSLTFRNVAVEDLPALAVILNYYVENTTVTFHTALLRAEDMQEKVFFSNGRYQAFVIETDKNTIGYCAVSPWKKQEAYAQTAEINIYLANAFTGKGIGPIAINYLEDFANQQGIDNLIAGICSENIPSIRLFEKAGYQHCARFEKVGRKFGRVLDTVYLQKIG